MWRASAKIMLLRSLLVQVHERNPCRCPCSNEGCSTILWGHPSLNHSTFGILLQIVQALSASFGSTMSQTMRVRPSSSVQLASSGHISTTCLISSCRPSKHVRPRGPSTARCLAAVEAPPVAAAGRVKLGSSDLEVSGVLPRNGQCTLWPLILRLQQHCVRRVLPWKHDVG